MFAKFVFLFQPLPTQPKQHLNQSELVRPFSALRPRFGPEQLPQLMRR